MTEKQRALITALAELDEDVKGTVNGVNENNKTEGKFLSCRKYMLHIYKDYKFKWNQVDSLPLTIDHNNGRCV